MHHLPHVPTVGKVGHSADGAKLLKGFKRLIVCDYERVKVKGNH